jgi:hypothetical protein
VQSLRNWTVTEPWQNAMFGPERDKTPESSDQ